MDLYQIVMSNRPDWSKPELFGLVVSAAIEVTQLVTCRGLFEYDDMIGNSIGCMVGCLLSSRI